MVRARALKDLLILAQSMAEKTAFVSPQIRATVLVQQLVLFCCLQPYVSLSMTALFETTRKSKVNCKELEQGVQALAAS